jgi:hypothetical protein
MDSPEEIRLWHTDTFGTVSRIMPGGERVSIIAPRARPAGGATDEAYVMRNIDDSNDLTINLGQRDLERAKAFTQTASLKEIMQKPGVTGTPEIRFLEASA